MVILSTTSAILLALAAVSSAHKYRRQDGPVDPSTSKYCTYYDTAKDKSYNCAYFESFWGVSHSDFVAWNPSVKSDCSGIKVGNSYCVEVTLPTTTTTTTPTTSPAPSPTQSGLTKDCNNFYKAVSGDTCDKIVAKYGTFTTAQFLQWNPAVGSDCSGLQANVYYCVGVPGTPTSRATTTTTTSTTTKPSNGVTTPTPTQPGMVDNCNTFYYVKSGDSCQAIADTYGITLTQFTSWQNVGGSQCTALQASVYVCVNIIGRTPSSTTKKTTTTTTTKPSNGVTTPTPTQPGMVNNCNQFYFVKSGDACQAIADKFGVTLAQFTSWQNVGGSSCTALQANVYVCVNIIGRTPSSTTKTTTTTTKSSNGITTPTPTQPGMVSNCDQFYYVKSGDGCQAIADKYGISLSQFTSWQNVGGSSCSALQANVYVCVSIVGQTATPKPTTTTVKTTTTSTCPTAHPTPTQPGAVCKCKKYHKVVDGNTCATIQKQYDITASQFNSWNPQVGSDCKTLWKGYYVCVSA